MPSTNGHAVNGAVARNGDEADGAAGVAAGVAAGAAGAAQPQVYGAVHTGSRLMARAGAIRPARPIHHPVPMPRPAQNQPLRTSVQQRRRRSASEADLEAGGEVQPKIPRMSPVPETAPRAQEADGTTALERELERLREAVREMELELAQERSRSEEYLRQIADLRTELNGPRERREDEPAPPPPPPARRASSPAPAIAAQIPPAPAPARKTTPAPATPPAAAPPAPASPATPPARARAVPPPPSPAQPPAPILRFDGPGICPTCDQRTTKKMVERRRKAQMLLARTNGQADPQILLEMRRRLEDVADLDILLERHILSMERLGEPIDSRVSNIQREQHLLEMYLARVLRNTTGIEAAHRTTGPRLEKLKRAMEAIDIDLSGPAALPPILPHLYTTRKGAQIPVSRQRSTRQAAIQANTRF